MPDARLKEFISNHLPAVLPEHRKKFNEYRDLLEDFADGFIGLSRIRRSGSPMQE
jgi:hypothetical protein